MVEIATNSAELIAGLNSTLNSYAQKLAQAELVLNVALSKVALLETQLAELTGDAKLSVVEKEDTDDG